jgi:hypothetical protein
MPSETASTLKTWTLVHNLSQDALGKGCKMDATT